MKKYQQLLLIISSLISLTLFLVYRHEYNRLHYVLEVFNFFGTPCNFSEFKKSDNILEHYDWGQIPLWQENDNHYTFSGFVNKSSVEVIVLQNRSAKAIKKCFLWYEDHQDPRIGQISFHQFAQHQDLQAYIYTCGYQFIEHYPYAVSFASKYNLHSSKKVLLTKLESRNITIKLTVCVPPRNYNKRELIEFLSFHKLIGIEYFIFYYNDIPNHLTKFLSNLSTILNIQATFIPWNFPKYFRSLTSSIVEKDCIFRTAKKSKASLVLNLNEYLVPLDSYSVYPLFEDASYLLKNIDIPVQKNCITSTDTFHPIAIQNTKTIDYGEELIVRKMNIQESRAETKNKNKFQMAIHAYEYCSNYSRRMVDDKTITRYSTDFIRSTLIQLLIHDQL